MNNWPVPVRPIDFGELDWQEDAECQWYNPSLFDPFGHRSGKKDWRRVERAVRICERCIARSACLDFALKERLSGVWGGVYLTEGVLTVPSFDVDQESTA